ncbi:MAG: phospholipid carrier-dependent glycosyltransferase, partial [Verrucomicrobia bacterium]
EQPWFPYLPVAAVSVWFAGAAVVGRFHRRAGWGLGILAVLAAGMACRSEPVVGVVAGAALGAAIGWAGVALSHRLWQGIGRRWFPLWWRALPSIRPFVWRPDPLAPLPGAPPVRDAEGVRQRQWYRLGIVFIWATLLFRLAYIASGAIELSEDEAYQWVWSKHPDLSYYSKPPMIAYLQWVGTHLWGDTELGVRFFSPVLAALLSWVTLRFFTREVSARAGFFLILCVCTAPMMAVGSVLMTIDPPLVLCWTLAMYRGWKAVQPSGTTRDWVWVGIWSGLGFLSKYSASLQWVSFFLFLAAWSSARRHLKRPGPWLGLAVHLLATAPVVLWNARHDWITVTHLQDRAGLTHAWQWQDFLRFFPEFTGAVFGLLNPVFAVGLAVTAVMAWRRHRRDGLLMYFLAMGAPLFLGYWLYTIRSRVHPNWIAPAVLPLFAVMVVHADRHWNELRLRWGRWLAAGLVMGGLAVGFLHDTDVAVAFAGKPLPPKLDPLRRVRGWAELGRIVEADRRRFEESSGRPVFVIGDHYGITGELSFYLPGHRSRVKDDPIVFYQTWDRPVNQFYFYPGYRDRKGQNAIYVLRIKEALRPAPANIVAEFERVEDLGVREVRRNGVVLRRVQLFACHGLR